MDFTPDKLRARFHELTEDYDRRVAKLEPLHKELRDLVADTAKREQSIRAKILKIREGMYELEQERATLARALGGKTGVAS